MKQMSSNELRKTFLDYFKSHQHQVVPGSSLVPEADPTLLFTNAGMVQFKNIFLGREPSDFSRATSAQRCVRAGGKHNDLDNVGYTARHHTFFEMLGNFSFGDYFKREAIRYAWNFLTQVLNIPVEKLWITVYEKDQESENIWLKEFKIDPKRFSRCGEKDNFWAMGDTGPCGPCTEIFYDHGPEIPGGPPGSLDAEGDRYIEIWNIVFMQFNRDPSGNLTPLPAPCVDTGMGLERISAILQGVHSNYEIDLFQHLLKALLPLTQQKQLHNSSMHAVADHIRSSAFLIADGVVPSNEGRGYVLRRIIRRAIRHGYKLGIKETFFYRLVQPLVEVMGEAYPELDLEQGRIELLLKQEETQFADTLNKGLKILEEAILGLTAPQIPGELVFQLYDTYGFPKDLTADIARERRLTIDERGFETAMAKQRQQSQQSSHFKMDYTVFPAELREKTTFVGYEHEVIEARITHLLAKGETVSLLRAGEEGVVILDRTPFYAESGGQVGDSGHLYASEGCFLVLDTQKQGEAFLHLGRLELGNLQVGDKIRAEISSRREGIKLNHSATHLLHAALREILGAEVLQKGSLVDADRLRFDFSYPHPLLDEQKREIECLVNQKIRENLPAEIIGMSLEEAKRLGVMALFGEKYTDQVRVIRFGDFSTELCGGIHVARTGDIGFFKILTETACAAGVRRMEALTGPAAIKWLVEREQLLQELSALLHLPATALPDRVGQLLQAEQSLEKELLELRGRLAKYKGGELLEAVKEVHGIQVLTAYIEQADRLILLNILDLLKQKISAYAIVLATVQEGKVSLVAGVAKECQSYFKAADLLNQVARQVGGKGGGRPDLAQGGGDQPEHLEKALNTVLEWIKQKVPAC